MQTTCARCVATFRLIEVQKPTAILILSTSSKKYILLFETPQNDTFNRVGVSFGKRSYVKVGCAVSHSKGLTPFW